MADHMKNVEDGAGCTEIWEYLSEQRRSGECQDSDIEESGGDAANRK